MGLIEQLAGNALAATGLTNSLLGAGVQGLARSALSATFPDQLETYKLSLQLLWEDGDAANESFTFPVMPESLMMAQRYLTTITPTLGGVYVDDFGRAPSPISLTGTFGRKARSVLDPSTKTVRSEIRHAVTDVNVLTGYGAVRALSQFVERSHTPQGPRGVLPRVVFYNWAFNSHWEVVISGLDVSMDVNQNGLWIYKLELTTLAPFEVSILGGVEDALLTGVVNGILSKASPGSVGAVVTAAQLAVAQVSHANDVVAAGKSLLGFGR